MRGDDPRCARRDRGLKGNRGALPRGGQARLRSDRELFAGYGGGAQDLHRTEGKNRGSGRDRQAKAKKEVSSYLPSDGGVLIAESVGSCSWDENLRHWVPSLP